MKCIAVSGTQTEPIGSCIIKGLSEYVERVKTYTEAMRNHSRIKIRQMA